MKILKSKGKSQKVRENNYKKIKKGFKKQFGSKR